MHQSLALQAIQEEQKFEVPVNPAATISAAASIIPGQAPKQSPTDSGGSKRTPVVSIESASPLKKSRMTSVFPASPTEDISTGTGVETLNCTDTTAANSSLYDAQTTEQYENAVGTVAGPSEETASGKVLLLRRLPPGVHEKDVEAIVLPFCRGVAPKVFLQALSGFSFVEFVDEDAAGAALDYLKRYPVVLKGSTVEVMRSKRENVVNSTEAASGYFRVLLASISNIAYPVDLELLNFLFSKYGVVEKIVTFMKNPATFQALVQFADPEQASYALTMLNNRNIYDSCNSLQLQPSKLKELTVRVNNAKTWDFTATHANYNHAGTPSQVAPHFLPGGGAQQPTTPAGAMHNTAPGAMHTNPAGVMHTNPAGVMHTTPAGAMHTSGVPGMPIAAGGMPGIPGPDASKAALPPGSLLPTPMNPMAPQQHQGQRSLFMPNDAMMTGYGQSPHMHPMYAQSMMGGSMGAHHGIPGMPMDPSGGRAPHPYGVAARPASPLDNAAIQAKMPRELREVNFDTINPTNTPLIIVYHLSSDLVDVMQLFNLFSLYGPVLRIKILRDKRDTALIQYIEPHFATLAFTYLQGVPVYSEESGIQICFSKNSEVIMPMQRPGESGADCRTRSFFAKEQRYPANEPEKYFRSACKPRCTLFVAGLPENASEAEVRSMFALYGETTSFKFRDSTEMAKKKAAHIEMTNESQAVKALCNLHDQTIRDGHNIKVAFSRAVIRQ